MPICKSTLKNGKKCPYSAKHGCFCGYHKNKQLSLQDRIDQLPLDCSELIYKHVRDISYKKVVSELQKEMKEYWEFVRIYMYQDEDYLSAHRTLDDPEPPIVNGEPDYDDDEYRHMMDDYLNTYDLTMDEDNYLIYHLNEAEYIHPCIDFTFWMLEGRPW